jgi:Cd2+/Zn2+-exporting ATPase
MRAAREDSRSVLRLHVGDMDCSGCLSSITTHVRRIDGVHRVEGSVLNRTLSVTVDDARVAPGDLRREIAGLGYTAEMVGGAPPRAPNPWLGAQARRVYAALGLALVGALTWIVAADVVLFSSSRYVIGAHGAWFAVSALVGGWNFFPKGFAAAKRLSLDMNSLMSVAIVGALLLGEFFEAASIAVLFSVAELLETYSVDRARASIESLMDLAPERAVVVRGGVEVTVAASDLAAGDELVVRPGDRIAADGTILHGTSAVDQSPITGESLPVEKAPGDAIFSGTINTAGHLRIRVDRPASESALAKIVRLVEEAEATKTQSERFVERFARFYTPTITIAAIAIAVGPPVLLGAPATLWITRGLTLLVIACPCALVISTPVAVVSGLTAAARHGVLIKGGVFLEALGSVTAFAFDKTGTLTVGRPTVRAIAVVAGDERDMLARAAALERHSEHPLGRAIVEEADERGIEHTALEVTGFVAIAGEGARAVIDGQEHVIGRPSLFPGERVPAGLQGGRHSLVGLSRGGALLGWIALADRQRDGAAEAVAGLRAEGIRQIVMLTGDNRETAEAIRVTVGLDEARAELLPADKLALLNDLEREHGGVAMVGDGVNDAPALAAATVGIAMGAAGSDAALQTADVALMGDDLRRLPYLVRLSRRARAVIRQNIAAAIAIKAILAIGVPLGYVSLITAVVVGDMGVSLAVTLNALRLGRVAE